MDFLAIGSSHYRKIAFLGSTVAFVTTAFAAPPHPLSAKFSCTEEIGTEVKNVGTYILTGPTSQSIIVPGQCLRSSNSQFVAVNQAGDGNFVVYRTTGKVEWKGYGATAQRTTIVVQADGHFVAYPEANVRLKNGTYHGDPGTDLKANPIETSSIDSYFLIMEDNGALALFRGPAPELNSGLVWTVGGSPLGNSCISLYAADQSLLKRIPVTTSHPVSAYANGPTAIAEWNKLRPGNQKDATSFRFNPGNCSD